MPRFCKTCGVDAPNAGQCGDVAGVRHEFIEGNSTHFNDFIIWIYFDEIFILFLLLFLISWFHVCCLSFSGTGVDEQKKVSFEFLDVPVIHWQHLVAKKIPIFESTDFCRKIRASFSDEITTKMFLVYRLPHKFSSIDEKVLIDSNEDFQECASLFKNPFEFPPELYIWNYEDV